MKKLLRSTRGRVFTLQNLDRLVDHTRLARSRVVALAPRPLPAPLARRPLAHPARRPAPCQRLPWTSSSHAIPEPAPSVTTPSSHDQNRQRHTRRAHSHTRPLAAPATGNSIVVHHELTTLHPPLPPRARPTAPTAPQPRPRPSALAAPRAQRSPGDPKTFSKNRGILATA